MCISNTIPRGGDAAGPGPTLGTPILEPWVFRGSFEPLMLTCKLSFVYRDVVICHVIFAVGRTVI